jgi:hypothetical protein
MQGAGPPQQWPSVQPPNQPMNMNYGMPPQSGSQQPPSNIPPQQQRGPPLPNSNQPLVGNYSSPQQIHQGINSQQPPMGLPDNPMIINPQQAPQNFGGPGPFVGSLPPHNPNMRSSQSNSLSFETRYARSDQIFATYFRDNPEKRKLIQQQLGKLFLKV